MELKINRKEFRRVEEESCYNSNVYMHIENSYKIKEECEEFYNTYSYYVFENDNWNYIGLSFGKSIEENPVIKYKEIYT